MALEKEIILAQIEQDSERFRLLVNGDGSVTVQLEEREVKSLQGQIDEIFGEKLQEVTVDTQAVADMRDETLAARDLARDWATSELEVEVGLGSARTYALAAEAAQEAGEQAKQAAELAQGEAEGARDIALGAAQASSEYRDAAGLLRDETAGLRDETAGLRDEAQGLVEGISPETIVRKDSDEGGIRVPRGTVAQRPGGNYAYLRYNTELGTWEGSPDGVEWGSIGGGATGGGGNRVFVENDKEVTEDYTIPPDKNAMSTGPLTIADGVSVTVSDGARWVIL